VIEKSPLEKIYRSALEALIGEKEENPVFHAIKLIENDPLEAKNHPVLAEKIKEMKADFKEDLFGSDFEAMIADARYKYITANFSPLYSRPERDVFTRSEKADKVLTHRIFGIPIFAFIMFSIFHLIFGSDFLYLSIFGIEPIGSPGVLLQTSLGNLTALALDAARAGLSSAPPWVTSLLVDGLLSGVDAVLSFLPQMLLLFLFLSILEDTGYMARAAFILDRAFRKLGLSGRAFLPLLMCFGCGVPGIMATRALGNDRERRIAITIAPFFSCGAKLPIWATFAGTLFLGRGGEFVVFGMYFLGIASAIILAALMQAFGSKREAPPFIMELPAYRLPQGRNTLAILWDKLKHYVTRVTTVIAGAVIVIWFLTSFTFSFKFVSDSSESILATVCKGIQWLFVPLGFGMGENGWKFIVAAFTGIIAKEMVVATLGVFAGGGAAGALATSPLAALIGTLSVPAALAFMAFNLLSVPCMAAVAAARGELNNRRKFWETIGIWLGTAYAVSAAIYWSGTYWWAGIAVAVVFSAAITTALYLRRRTNKT
jgi:Fe2+ transport system protein B